MSVQTSGINVERKAKPPPEGSNERPSAPLRSASAKSDQTSVINVETKVQPPPGVGVTKQELTQDPRSKSMKIDSHHLKLTFSDYYTIYKDA